MSDSDPYAQIRGRLDQGMTIDPAGALTGAGKRTLERALGTIAAQKQGDGTRNRSDDSEPRTKQKQ